jgi:hypothetical protein
MRNFDMNWLIGTQISDFKEKYWQKNFFQRKKRVNNVNELLSLKDINDVIVWF